MGKRNLENSPLKVCGNACDVCSGGVYVRMTEIAGDEQESQTHAKIKCETRVNRYFIYIVDSHSKQITRHYQINLIRNVDNFDCNFNFNVKSTLNMEQLVKIF